MQLGCDVTTVVSRAGVSPDIFKHPDQPISYPDAGRLLDECVAATDCAHFGLLVGQRCSLAGLGFVGDAVRAETNVGDALRTLVRYLPLFDRGSVLSIRMVRNDVLFAYGILAGGMPGAAHAYDVALMVAFNTVKELCGSCWSPSVVTLPHKAPSDVRLFRRLFETEITFDATEASLVFDRFWLARSLAYSTAAERLRLLYRAARIATMLDLTTSERVHRQMRANLPARWLQENQVAAQLQMTTRTLRRRLAEEGTSFRTLVDQLRYETARQYLSTSLLECADIALLLGYSDPSAFTRAFRRWSGKGPNEWRSERTIAA
jgi:AraC-like DNA-binding protein